MDDRSLGSIRSQLARDESGSILVLVAFSTVLLVAAAALAIDIGKQITAAAEAQAAADAAALAGAGVLAAVPGAQDLARTEATLYAAKNEILGDPVDITDGDVTFFTSSGWDSVRVVVRRRSGSPDGPIASIFGGFFGVDSMEVERDAIAWVKETGSPPDCPVPFGIPDLWLEEPAGTVAGQNDEYDPGIDTYRAPSAHPDNFTGYQLPRDWGREVVVYNKSGKSGGTYNPSWWGPWNPRSNAGRGSAFEEAVTKHNCGVWQEADFDQSVNTTPGAAQGPSTGCFQGGQGCGSGGTPVINQDPQAEWVMPGTFAYNSAGCFQTTGCMVRQNGGSYDQISASERIRTLPLYHPDDVVNSSPGNNTTARITNFVGVFFDRVENRPGGAKAVIGYVVGLVGSGEDAAPSAGVTTRTVQLVE